MILELQIEYMEGEMDWMKERMEYKYKEGWTSIGHERRNKEGETVDGGEVMMKQF